MTSRDCFSPRRCSCRCAMAACLPVRAASAPARRRCWSFAPLPALLAALLVPGGTLAFFPPPFRMIARARPVRARSCWAAPRCCGALPAPMLVLYGEARPAAALRRLVAADADREASASSSSRDLASFYLVFTLVSLAAYGLIVHDADRPRPASRRGLCGARAAWRGVPAAGLRDARAPAARHANPFDPRRRSPPAGIADARRHRRSLLIVGFALKMGLVPLHVWLPLAHPAAPMPASAVLSGVVVKAGVIGLIRFLPFEAGLPCLGRRAHRGGHRHRLSTASPSASPRQRRKPSWPIPPSARWASSRRSSGWGRGSRCRHANSGGLLRAASHAGEGRPVPGGRHPGRDRREAAASPAPRHRSSGAQPWRHAPDQRRACQARDQADARLRSGGSVDAGSSGQHASDAPLHWRPSPRRRTRRRRAPGRGDARAVARPFGAFAARTMVAIPRPHRQRPREHDEPQGHLGARLAHRRRSGRRPCPASHPRPHSPCPGGRRSRCGERCEAAPSSRWPALRRRRATAQPLVGRRRPACLGRGSPRRRMLGAAF